MKNAKSHKSSHSRPSFRASPSAKARDGGEDRPQKPFYKGAKAKPGFRSNEKPRFGEKPAFGTKTASRSSASSARTRDGEESRPSKPFYKGARTKPDFRSDEKPAFKGKPRFGGTGKPAFRKPRPETKKEEAFKPAGDSVLIWGLHAVRAAYMNPKRRITRLWLTEAGKKLFEKTQNDAHDELLKRPDAKIAERDALDRLVPPNSVHQGIVIEAAPLPEVALHDVIAADPPPDLLLMLDQVTDPHNVGAILRSAAAFGAGAVILPERNAPTTTGVLAKSASGALECTPMIHVVNLSRALDDLREAGYWCVGLAEEGDKNLADIDLSGRTVLVLGAEGEGLRHLTRQKCDALARLPTQGPIGSLNVSNAAAVALYEVRKQAK